MYLQLAEGESNVQSALVNQETNPYILIPDPTGRSRKGIYVREDHFDHLSNKDFYDMMKNLAPFQDAVRNGNLSEGEFLSGKAERKQKRKDKQDLKVAKQKAKIDVVQSKADKKRSTGKAKETRAEGKRLKGERGGGGGFDKYFDKVAGVATDIFGKNKGGGADDSGGGDTSVDTSKKGGGGGASDETPWYKTPMGMGGLAVGGLAVVGLGVMAMKKGSKPAMGEMDAKTKGQLLAGGIGFAAGFLIAKRKTLLSAGVPPPTRTIRVGNVGSNLRPKSYPPKFKLKIGGYGPGYGAGGAPR
jgi:hypothetical protein